MYMYIIGAPADRKNKTIYVIPGGTQVLHIIIYICVCVYLHTAGFTPE